MSSVNRDEYLAALGRDSGRITEVGATAWGIDEFVDLLLPMPMFFRYAEFAGTGETILLDASHDDRTWAITIDPGAAVRSSSESNGEVDVSVRGGLSDLYLYLLGRRTAGPVDVRGDDELLSRFRAAVVF
jgi:hypothetical protein